MGWPLSVWRKLPKLKSVGQTFHTSPACSHIIKLTRLRVVDNSELGKQAMAEGKPPKCIHIYNKKGIGTIGTYLKIICEILCSISRYKYNNFVYLLNLYLKRLMWSEFVFK
jgi:hypothetical protein